MTRDEREEFWTVLVWRTAVQIFNVGVVVVVFAYLHGRLEVIVVSLFGITYAAIRGGVIGNALAVSKLVMGLQKELNSIRTAVDPAFVPDNYRLDDAREESKKAEMGFWFQFVGLGIVSLICLYKLFSALFG